MDIYQALTNDHNELKPLLDRLVEASEADRDTGKILERIHALLIPHSRAEEAVFYNSLREIEGAKSCVAHTYREHMAAETMLRTLKGFEKINVEWTTLAKKLREALLHHIQEEESVIFAKARQVFLDTEAQQMALAFEEAKQQAEEQGDIKNMMDMVANLMPKRFGDKMRQSRTPT
jgi:hemerythrin superfamily protein